MTALSAIYKNSHKEMWEGDENSSIEWAWLVAAIEEKLFSAVDGKSVEDIKTELQTSSDFATALSKVTKYEWIWDLSDYWYDDDIVKCLRTIRTPKAIQKKYDKLKEKYNSIEK